MEKATDPKPQVPLENVPSGAHEDDLVAYTNSCLRLQKQGVHSCLRVSWEAFEAKKEERCATLNWPASLLTMTVSGSKP